MDSYEAFLATKRVRHEARGMAEIPPLAHHLFDFQRHCVEFGLRTGSWGLYLDTGLGKTACQLEWMQCVIESANTRPGLILTPLAVARQIEREAHRWGYDARIIREQSEAKSGINICNYDRLDKLDISAFGAVSLDEASILKNFTGKTSRALIDAFAGHRWKMVATATPAPNDHRELGQQCEFLSMGPLESRTPHGIRPHGRQPADRARQGIQASIVGWQLIVARRGRGRSRSDTRVYPALPTLSAPQARAPGHVFHGTRRRTVGRSFMTHILLLHICLALAPGSQISDCHAVRIEAASKAECVALRRAAIDWHLRQPQRPGVMAGCVEVEK